MNAIFEHDYFYTNTAQSVLSDYYKHMIGSPFDYLTVPESPEGLAEVRLIEDSWMASEEASIEGEILPSNELEFIGWYSSKLNKLNDEISGFLNYLENDATPEAIAFYVGMEELVDGSFDDIMALAQIGVETDVKMTIAENYWDEMGNGDFARVHTTMFDASVNYCRELLDKKNLDLPTNIPTECLMNGNIIFLWSLRRKFIPRLFGAIGLIEGSASRRFDAVTNGMERCGYPESAIAYHREHILIDKAHGKDWLSKLLSFYVKNSELLCQEISRGVLIRYKIAKDYYRCIESIVRDKCR